MSKSPNLPINTQLPYKQKQDKLWQSKQINNMMRKLSRLPVLNLLSAKTNKLRLLNHPMFLRSLLIKSQELKLLPQQSQNKLRHLLLLKFFLKSRQQNKRQKFNKFNLLSDRNMRRPLNRLLSLRNKKSLCRLLLRRIKKLVLLKKLVNRLFKLKLNNQSQSYQLSQLLQFQRLLSIKLSKLTKIWRKSPKPLFKANQSIKLKPQLQLKSNNKAIMSRLLPWSSRTRSPKKRKELLPKSINKQRRQSSRNKLFFLKLLRKSHLKRILLRKEKLC